MKHEHAGCMVHGVVAVISRQACVCHAEGFGSFGNPWHLDVDNRALLSFAVEAPADLSAEALAPGASPIDAAETEAPKGGLRGRYAWLGTIASLAILAGSLFVLWKLVETVTWAEMHAAFTGASAEQLGFAFLFVGLSYLFLTCYDALALRQLKLKVPYRTTALASFTSYAVSFTLGFPLLTAGTIRYWIYSSKGLGAAKIAALTVIAGFTFWLGMGVVLGLSLIVEAGQLAALTFTSIALNQGVGFGALLAVVAYLLWVSLKRRHVRVKSWRLELPGASVSLSQMVVGIGHGTFRGRRVLGGGVHVSAPAARRAPWVRG